MFGTDAAITDAQRSVNITEVIHPRPTYVTGYHSKLWEAAVTSTASCDAALPLQYSRDVTRGMNDIVFQSPEYRQYVSIHSPGVYERQLSQDRLRNASQYVQHVGLAAVRNNHSHHSPSFPKKDSPAGDSLQLAIATRQWSEASVRESQHASSFKSSSFSESALHRSSEDNKTGVPDESRTKKKKRRVLFTKEQVSELQRHFRSGMYVTATQREELARSLRLTQTQVKIWFQNHRYKLRKENPGIDTQPVPNSQLVPASNSTHLPLPSAGTGPTTAPRDGFAGASFQGSYYNVPTSIPPSYSNYCYVDHPRITPQFHPSAQPYAPPYFFHNGYGEDTPPTDTRCLFPFTGSALAAPKLEPGAIRMPNQPQYNGKRFYL